MIPTDDPRVDAYLAETLRRLERRLGPTLVGLYLLNSGARGDYLPGRSDLDLAVIVASPLDAATKARVAGDLRHRAHPCPAPRLELVVYRSAVARAPGAAPAFELNLNTGPAIADRLTTDPADEPPHWFVLDLAAAADVALAVAGPPAESVFGGVPRRTALEALVASRAWHAVHDTVAPNRVLNDCRGWRYAVEARWSSKAEAAGWAIARGARRDLVETALARRAGTSVEPLPPAMIDDLSARVGAAIDEALRTA